MELDKPELQSDGYFLVHTENEDGDVVKVKFKDPSSVDLEECKLITDKSLPDYWRCKMYEAKATDCSQIVVYDFESKKVRSVRDGVQEYMGVELGLEPSDKVFTVYRSPATITKIFKAMDGLPVINDHIDPSVKPKDSEIIGIINDTEIVELYDKTYDSRLVLENKVKVSDEALKLVKSGKKELSLGYMAKFIAHDKYDFEQIDIKPAHLGIVDNARGGSVLRFLDKDKESKKMEMNLERMILLASQFSELLKKSTAEELAEYAPIFEKIAEKVTEEKKDETDGLESKEEETEDMEKSEEEATDEEKPEPEVKDEEKEIEEDDKKVEDSKSFKDALAAHFATVEKAKKFLDASYVYAGRTSEQIKKDALKAYGVSCEDSEIDVAFKLLKKSDRYNNFGDNKEKDAWAALEDREF